MDVQRHESSFFEGFKKGLGVLAALVFVFMCAPCAMCGGLTSVADRESSSEGAVLNEDGTERISKRRQDVRDKKYGAKPQQPGDSNEIVEESKPSPQGKWDVHVRTSEMDDSKTVVLALDSENRVENWLSQTKRARLLIRCQENRTSAYVNTGMQANPELGNYNQAHARIRLDKDEPKRVNMSESTDGEALFFPGSTRYPKMMEGKTKMLFEFTPFNQSKVHFEFDLTGIDEVLPQVKEACGWG